MRGAQISFSCKPSTATPHAALSCRLAPQPSRFSLGPSKQSPFNHIRTRNRLRLVHRAEMGSMGSDQSGDDMDDIADRMESSRAVLEEMLNEITHVLMVDAAVAEVVGEKPETTQRQAVRAVVEERIETLDESFLAALSAYIQAAKSGADESLVTMLEDIRDETLGLVRDRMPPELRALDQLVRLDSAHTLTAVLRTLRDQGRAMPLSASQVAAASRERLALDLPPETNLLGLMLATAQMIEDMENTPYIPDRRLLARLCLLREAVRIFALEEQAGMGAGQRGPLAPALEYREQLPLTEATFIQDCLNQRNAQARAKGVHKALSDDTYKVDAKPKSAEEQKVKELEARLRKGKEGPSEEEIQEAERAFRYVRPGRFLDCLMAFSIELERRGPTVAAQRQRVQEIWVDARRALAVVAEYQE